LIEQRLGLVVLAAGNIGERDCELEARIVRVAAQRLLADRDGLNIRRMVGGDSLELPTSWV
jgi:hypothetical protein